MWLPEAFCSFANEGQMQPCGTVDLLFHAGRHKRDLLILDIFNNFTLLYKHDLQVDISKDLFAKRWVYFAHVFLKLSVSRRWV